MPRYVYVCLAALIILLFNLGLYLHISKLDNDESRKKKLKNSIQSILMLICIYGGYAASMVSFYFAIDGHSVVALCVAILVLAVPFTLFFSTPFVRAFGRLNFITSTVLQISILLYLKLMGVL